MKRKPEILRLDIVLLGDFNPKIFSPAWFAAYDLIGELESQEAEVEMIHKDVAIFNLDWFRLQVTRDRFSIFTEQEAYFEKLTELVLHTFTHLAHTPIRAIGMNWGGHFKAESEKELDQFGYFLAPQKPWKNIFDDSAVLRIEMTEKIPRTDFSKGAFQVRVESSKLAKPGIFININDHYELEDKKQPMGCKDIISLFEANKDDSKEKIVTIVNDLFNNFEGK
ncbi:MAG: hypothetical protein GY870_15555 [archaeon]|nr:hypothetical protein [archaeon]